MPKSPADHPTAQQLRSLWAVMHPEDPGGFDRFLEAYTREVRAEVVPTYFDRWRGRV